MDLERGHRAALGFAVKPRLAGMLPGHKWTSLSLDLWEGKTTPDSGP